MNEDQFSALLAAVVPGVVVLIVTRDGLSEQDAAEAFFSSETYARLYDYVMKFFGAFHTMGEELVFNEIDAHVARLG